MMKFAWILGLLMSSSVFAQSVKGRPVYQAGLPQDRPIQVIINKAKKENEGLPYLNPRWVLSFECRSISNIFADYSVLSVSIEGIRAKVDLMNYSFSEPGNGLDECKAKSAQLRQRVETARAKGQYLLVSNPKAADNYEDVILTVPEQVRAPVANIGLNF